MSIDDVRKRGRPAVGATPVTLRLPPEDLAALDRWIATQDDAPTRPEAIRRIMRKTLEC